MLSFSVFAVSLFGLAAIAGCKILELGGKVRTPLTLLRRVGDPMLTEGWAKYRAQAREAIRSGFRASVLSVAATARKAEIAFYATVHAIAARLNRYLRARRLHKRIGGEVSAHLKTVLEKTQKNTEPPSAV